ncbi:MAG: T9SS type A sorting domain-containing protein [Sphingobacteriales bacterium]|nr:T9SS type A sorting domain-containing protein [Sphingobacteriales bacterium]
MCHTSQWSHAHYQGKNINLSPPPPGSLGQFNDIGIYLRGSTFQVSNNLINYNVFGTILMGNGNTPNAIFDNGYNSNFIPVWAFGQNGVQGIEGNGTDLYCNRFNNYITSWWLSNYDPPVGSPFPFESGSLSDQGDCNTPGLFGTPTDNLFNGESWSTVLVSGMPTSFTYYYRNDPSQNFLPTVNDPALINVEECIGLMISQEEHCNISGIKDDDDIKAISIEKWLNREALRKLFYYGEQKNAAAARDLLKDINTNEAYSRMLPQYIKEQDATKVSQTITQLPDEQWGNAQWKELYGLYWDIVQDGRKLDQLTTEEEAIIRQIAMGGTRAAYDAHTMLYLLYGEEYEIPLPPLPTVLNSTAAALFSTNAIYFKTDAAGNLIPYISPPLPNPTQAQVSLSYCLPDGEKGLLRLYDMSGKLLQTRHFEQSGQMSIDTQHLSPGLYLYAIATNKGLTQQGKITIVP